MFISLLEMSKVYDLVGHLSHVVLFNTEGDELKAGLVETKLSLNSRFSGMDKT